MDQHTEDPKPLGEILTDGAELRDREKGISIIRSVAAIVSIVSSFALVWVLRRSRAGLSTTCHRVLLGMCIGDILYSLSLAHFNVTSSANDAYFVWNARGSQATCSAQGFLCVLGAAWGLLYNCSLNLHSLVVARYQLADRQVRILVEPFLHVVPVAFATILSVNLLAGESYNELSGGMCYSPVYEPPHCLGREDGEVVEGFQIPCGRGRDSGGAAFFYVYVIGIILLVPLVVGGSLWMIYREVRRQERRIKRYRDDETFAAVLQLPPLYPYGTGGYQDGGMEEPTDMACGVPVARPVPGADLERARPANLVPGSLEREGVVVAMQVVSEDISLSRANRALTRSRALLHRAFAFSFAYFLSFFFLAVGFFFHVVNAEWPTCLLYIVNIFNPLQGFFNFLMFMLQRALEAKNAWGDDITWRWAFSRAFWSRGNKYNSLAW